MNNLSMRKIISYYCSFYLWHLVQAMPRFFIKILKRRLFGKTAGNKKEVKVKEPRTVLKAKKKQEANKKKLDKEYAEISKRIPEKDS